MFLPSQRLSQARVYEIVGRWNVCLWWVYFWFILTEIDFYENGGIKLLNVEIIWLTGGLEYGIGFICDSRDRIFELRICCWELEGSNFRILIVVLILKCITSEKEPTPVNKPAETTLDFLSVSFLYQKYQKNPKNTKNKKNNT